MPLQLYLVAAGDSAADSPTAHTCPQCRAVVCTVCREVYHEGLSCAEYQAIKHEAPEDREFFKYLKQKGARRCPRDGCGAVIEKDGGCNHMTCLKCGAHICWVCMGIFDRGEVYTHMQDAHGGIYDAGNPH